MQRGAELDERMSLASRSQGPVEDAGWDTMTSDCVVSPQDVKDEPSDSDGSCGRNRSRYRSRSRSRGRHKSRSRSHSSRSSNLSRRSCSFAVQIAAPSEEIRINDHIQSLSPLPSIPRLPPPPAGTIAMSASSSAHYEFTAGRRIGSQMLYGRVEQQLYRRTNVYEDYDRYACLIANCSVSLAFDKPTGIVRPLSASQEHGHEVNTDKMMVDRFMNVVKSHVLDSDVRGHAAVFEATARDHPEAAKLVVYKKAKGTLIKCAKQNERRFADGGSRWSRTAGKTRQPTNKTDET